MSRKTTRLFMRTLSDLPTSEGPSTRVCEAARRALGVEGVSITLVTGTDMGQALLASAGQHVLGLHSVEDLLGCGPAYSAARDQHLVSITPTTAQAPWSTMSATTGLWINAVPTHDATAVLLTAGATSTDTSEDDLYEIASTATTLLTLRPDTLGHVTGQYATINTAVGMLCLQHALPPRDALAMLRARAFSAETSLDALAYQITHPRT